MNAAVGAEQVLSFGVAYMDLSCVLKDASFASVSAWTFLIIPLLLVVLGLLSLYGCLSFSTTGTDDQGAKEVAWAKAKQRLPGLAVAIAYVLYPSFVVQVRPRLYDFAFSFHNTSQFTQYHKCTRHPRHTEHVRTISKH